MPGILVGEPVSQALNRTGTLLFKPFQFNRWMIFAMGAALSLLGEGGSSFNWNSSSRRGGPGGAGGGGPSIQEIKRTIMDNLGWIVPVAILVFLVIVALWIVTRWLSSRGQFILMDNIVSNVPRVKEPWAEYRAEGNSLFRLRLLWDLLTGFIFGGITLIALVIVWADISNFIDTGEYHFTGHTGAALLFFIPIYLMAALVLWVLRGVVFRLGVPVMYVRRLQAWPAVKVAWAELFMPNKGACLLYFLMLIVSAIVQGIWMVLVTLVVGLCTCCVGFFVLIIPFVGTYIIALLSLPAIMFDRAYQLAFVSQFGPAYQVVWQMRAEGGFPVQMDESPPSPPDVKE